MSSVVSRALAIPKTHPFAFGVGFSCVKTSFADLMVQFTIEKKKWEEVDWKRNSAFALFGFFYLGGIQYALYVPIFGRMFPTAASFATKPLTDKLKDPRGFAGMLSQVFLDQCVHHPFLYFPVFYSLKETVAGGDPMDGLRKYQNNYKEDLLALWKIWVPATMINFTFSPMWFRIPFVASTSLIWTCVLSAMRGKNEPAEESSADLIGNQGRLVLQLRESVKLDPEQSHVIINAHGVDRVGLVAQIAELCANQNGSISESKMVRMGGHFMYMAVVSVSPDKKTDMTQSLVSGLSQKVDISIEDMTNNVRNNSKLSRTNTRHNRGQVAALRVSGPDRPGVVARVAALLCKHHFNIERMDTRVRQQGDAAVFEMTGLAHTSKDFDPAALRVAADSLSSDLGISLEFDFETVTK